MTATGLRRGEGEGADQEIGVPRKGDGKNHAYHRQNQIQRRPPRSARKSRAQRWPLPKLTQRQTQKQTPKRKIKSGPAGKKAGHYEGNSKAKSARLDPSWPLHRQDQMLRPAAKAGQAQKQDHIGESKCEDARRGGQARREAPAYREAGAGNSRATLRRRSGSRQWLLPKASPMAGNEISSRDSCRCSEAQVMSGGRHCKKGVYRSLNL